jgi:hypothetical protein
MSRQGRFTPYGKSVPSLKDQIPLLLYRFQFLQECLLYFIAYFFLKSCYRSFRHRNQGIVIIVAIIDL